MIPRIKPVNNPAANLVLNVVAIAAVKRHTIPQAIYIKAVIRGKL